MNDCFTMGDGHFFDDGHWKVREGKGREGMGWDGMGWDDGWDGDGMGWDDG